MPLQGPKFRLACAASLDVNEGELKRRVRRADPQVLSASYDENYDAIEKEGAILEEAIEVILSELGKSDPRALKARAHQFFDPSLLQGLAKEGFIKGLWSGSR